jgi:sodium transport system permease protein
MPDAAHRIATLYRSELRTLLRDRRMLVMSLLFPLLVVPIMLFAGRIMEERRDRELADREYVYAVSGPRAEDARSLVARAVQNQADGDAAGEASFHERAIADPAAALESRDIDFYVDAATVADLLARATGSSAPARLDPEERLRTLPGDLLAVSLVYRGDRDTSEAGARRLRAHLTAERHRGRTVSLAAAGFALAADDVMKIDSVDLAQDTQVAGLALGRIATLLLVMFLFMGGAVVAQDALAGEKERGTLETLLTTAASRREIVVAKLLLVVTVAVTITTIQVGNLLAYARLQLVPSAARLAELVTPSLAAGLLIFLLPLAALIAAALLLVSGYARSYKEAQFNFMPVLLLSAAPALAATLPGVSLRSAIVMVPIANISVGVRELLIDRIDWPFLIAAWLVNVGAAAWIIRLAEQSLSNERLIVPSLGDTRAPGGAPSMTAGVVFRWFAAMWGILLLLSLNLGPDFDIRGQLAINLGGIFLCGSILFLRHFRLRARDVLLLKPVRWPVWIAVSAGAPAALLTGIALARLVNLVVPVPREVLESFGQFLAPENISLWQLLPLLTVLPAIAEEVAFRGVLLQSLRRFFPPWKAAVLAGLVFGLFHVSLFRLFPTAFLGIILAAVTILSGSIFPAMAWHALNNGISLVLNHYGVALELLPSTTYAGAVLVLALSFWILWRVRAPAASSNREIRPRIAVR